MQFDTAATPIAITSSIAVIGTCFESIDNEGLPLAPETKDSGNFAICHWMYYTGRSTETSQPPEGGVVGSNWGEVRYLNEFEWADGGSSITGVSV